MRSNVISYSAEMGVVGDDDFYEFDVMKKRVGKFLRRRRVRDGKMMKN